MPTGTFTRSQYEEISKTCEDHTEEEIKKGFIGKDGKHHEYEYDEKKYMYRMHTSNILTTTTGKFSKRNTTSAEENPARSEK